MTPQEQALDFQLRYSVHTNRARLQVRKCLDRMCKEPGIRPIVQYEQAVRFLERMESREESARQALLDANER